MRRLRRWALLVSALCLLAACAGETPQDTGGTPQGDPGGPGEPGGEPGETFEVWTPFEEYALNPLIISVFTADPSARVFPNYPDRVFLYPSRDMFPPRGCDLMDRYRVFSSTDMANWTDEGEILRADDVPWGRPEGGFMWAPDCIYRDGKYYFFFPHPVGTGDLWNSTWTIGVAVSDSPTGGFNDNEIVRLRQYDGSYIEGSGRYIDPNIFVDDCGTYYFVVGGSNQLRVARLKPCMTQLDEPLVVLTHNRTDDRGAPIDPENFNKVQHFHEGPWMFSRTNDFGEKLYYIMHPGGLEGYDGDLMHYNISRTGPYGPWEYGGVILQPVPFSYTSHGSVVEFKGQWYIFYHNAIISEIAEARSVCAEPLFFDEYGMILPVTQTESGLRTIFDSDSPEFGEMRTHIEPSDGKEEPMVFFDITNPQDTPVRANVRVYHRTQRINSRMTVFFNGEDLSTINTVAGREYTNITLWMLPGDNRLIFNAGQGGPRVSHITVKFLD
jgi:hypothetical protein